MTLVALRVRARAYSSSLASSRLLRLKFAAALALLSASPAAAHVTLEQQQASPGSTYKIVLRVPHGCGKSATTGIRVTIPEGVVSVKPMVKPGWQIDVTRAAYQKPYSFLHGAKFTEGVTEVAWSGGKLPDDFYDEFVLSGFISGDVAPGGMLYFPVVQTCESGEHKWIDVPRPGEHPSEPAPSLKLVPKS